MSVWTEDQRHAISLLPSMILACRDAENDLEDITVRTRGVKAKASKTAGFIRTEDGWQQLSKAEMEEACS